MRYAKLTRPTQRRIHPRARLFSMLDRGRTAGALWLHGPAGSGKTSVVASWLQRRRLRSIWYQVDPGDADAAALFHYLTLGAAPLARRAVLPRFGPECLRGLEAFARRFARELWAALPRGAVVVLDDCHDAVESAGFRAVLRALLDERPRGACAVLVSRLPPPAALARSQAGGTLEVVSPADLRVTPAEAREIARIRGRGTAGRSADSACERAGGWAAGVVLALAAERRTQAADGGEDLLTRYFAGEVLDRLDETSRRILLEISLFARIEGAQADRLTGDPRAGALLADFVRRGLFVTAHGGRDPVFVLHPLFREFLRSRAERAIPAERLRAIRVAAAESLGDVDDLDEAVRLLTAAGAHDRAIALVLRHAPRLVSEGRGETLRGALAAIPEPARASEPWVGLWTALSWAGFDTEAVRRGLEEAHGRFWERGDPVGSTFALASMVDTFLVEFGDLTPLDRWIGVSDEHARRWPTLPAPPLEALAACARYTALASRRPDHPDLPALEQRVAAIAAHADDPRIRRKAAFAAIHFALWRGDGPAVRRTLEWLETMRQGWQEPSPVVSVAAMAARAHGGAGDGEAAMREAERGLAAAESLGARFVDVPLAAAGAFGALAAGDLARADAFVARMAAAASPRFSAWYPLFQRGAIALRRGEAAAARDLLERSLGAAETTGSPYLEAWSVAGLAAAAHALGDAPARARLLDACDAAARRTGAPLVRYWALLLRASAALGDEPERAAALLREGFALSRAAGPFQEAWLPRAAYADLCAHALDHGIEADHVRELVRRDRLPATPRAATCEGWPWPVAIRTLGGFSVERDGRALDGGAARAASRPLELLRTLVALGGRDVSERRVEDALWPDAEGDAAHHALETTVYRLRRLLGLPGAVVQRRGRLSIATDACFVDALALPGALQELRPALERDAPLAAAAALERALSLYRGPFLPDDDSPAAAERRALVRREVRLRVEQVCRALERAGAGDRAARLHALAAERDPALAARPLSAVS